MSAYDPTVYGDAWARAYDDLHQMPDLDAAVSALAALADGGTVLEFGTGTGRLALPLAARGVGVHGIEASEAMIARLRDKPGGAEAIVTRGDFTEMLIDGDFTLVVCAFHTLLSLPTQDLQVRCFERAAAHLAPGGRFVVEASVPRLDLAGPALPQPTVQRHDPLAQRLDSVALHVGDGGPVFLPITVRYAWPSELDLMARLAGMRLDERWADWSGAPFTASSQRHISVYRVPPDVRTTTG